MPKRRKNKRKKGNKIQLVSSVIVSPSYISFLSRFGLEGLATMSITY